jgi:hypothetical protein
MTAAYENYRAWYADLLPKLYDSEHAGFAILMVTFPLLERYMRQRNRLAPQDSLNDKCWNDLRSLFPVLADNQKASQFWSVFRNGILHQVTLSREKPDLSPLPVGFLGQERCAPVEVKADGSFWVQPVLFAKQVLSAIEKDFATFEDTTSAGTPLPKVIQYVESITVASKRSVYLGTGGRS